MPVPLQPVLDFAVRVDGYRATGVGHLVRQVALAEELLQRGHRVRFFGGTDLGWIRELLGAHGLELIDPEADFAGARAADASTAVMIDGYDYPASLGQALRAHAIPVATMVDDVFGRHQAADLYVDQNLGALAGHGAGQWLVGPDYVLLREVVLDKRGLAPDPSPRPRVLIVFGGTDAFAGCPVVSGLLLASGLAMDVVAVAATPELAREIAAIPAGPGQTVEVVGPQRDLPALAATCHVAVSAAGSSVWEFACIGLPTALVCVTDNQEGGYAAATSQLCVGLGHLDRLRGDPATRAAAIAAISPLLERPAVLQEYRRRAMATVDGRGRARVADALEHLAAGRLGACAPG
ncbi:MAG: PseG/SpsG family protein [Arachnia sp.]